MYRSSGSTRADRPQLHGGDWATSCESLLIEPTPPDTAALERKRELRCIQSGA